MAKQLTIRGVESNLYQILKMRAEQAGLSMNRFILSVLQESMGMTQINHIREIEYDDLDHLAGTWSQEEYEDFQTLFQAQRTIDSELWS